MNYSFVDLGRCETWVVGLWAMGDRATVRQTPSLHVILPPTPVNPLIA
ncbi:MAG: hypothetical protein AAGD25_02470 [Cyanobacteria bacterium P01_F01_bin.150]